MANSYKSLGKKIRKLIWKKKRELEIEKVRIAKLQAEIFLLKNE